MIYIKKKKSLYWEKLRKPDFPDYISRESKAAAEIQYQKIKSTPQKEAYLALRGVYLGLRKFNNVKTGFILTYISCFCATVEPSKPLKLFLLLSDSFHGTVMSVKLKRRPGLPSKGSTLNRDPAEVGCSTTEHMVSEAKKEK